MHFGVFPGFLSFEKISFVVKGVNVSCFCGSTVEEFRHYVNEASRPSVLRFFCTPGQWSRDLSYMLTGRHIPVILVYIKHADEGMVDRNRNKNRRKYQKKQEIPWEESLTKCFTEIECDCVVVNGTNVVGCENLNSLGMADVVLSVGYNITEGDSALGNHMSRLYDKLIPPKDSVGVDKRGDHVMKRFGYRACANVTSSGQVGKYASILSSEDRQEVDSLGKDVANCIWDHARTMFGNRLPFGLYPGGDVPMIAIGNTPFSALFITCNAEVPSHLDTNDEHGSVIAWCNKGDVQGGGFYLTEYFLRLRLHHDTVVFCKSCTHAHGSLAPSRGNGARYGVALVNKKATSTRARKQVAVVGLPLPKV